MPFPTAAPDELIASRFLNASCADVFAAIASPERLARWWGPHGFTNTFETCEFTPDGDWLFTMHGPDGSKYANINRFGMIVPNALVEIHHINAPVFTLSISLTPHQEDGKLGCFIGWRQRFESVELCQTLVPLIGGKNEENLDRLQAELTPS